MNLAARSGASVAMARVRALPEREQRTCCLGMARRRCTRASESDRAEMTARDIHTRSLAHVQVACLCERESESENEKSNQSFEKERLSISSPSERARARAICALVGKRLQSQTLLPVYASAGMRRPSL